MKKVASRFIRHSTGSKDPVVLLLGWAGARDEHLDKYGNIYQKKGYDTIRFTSALSDKIWSDELKNTREVSNLAKDVRDALIDKKLVIHCFSMNGIYTLVSLLLQYPELDVFKNTEGIIFDSCPARIDGAALSSYLQVMDYANEDRIKNFDWSERMQYKIEKGIMATKILRYLTKYYSYQLAGWDKSNFSVYHFLLGHHEMPKIIFFIYSDADVICPAKSVEEFCQHWRSKGYSIDELHLKDSEHVLHMRKHPTEYLQLIDKFLGKVKPRAKL